MPHLFWRYGSGKPWCAASLLTLQVLADYVQLQHLLRESDKCFMTIKDRFDTCFLCIRLIDIIAFKDVVSVMDILGEHLSLKGCCLDRIQGQYICRMYSRPHYRTIGRVAIKAWLQVII